MMSSLQALIFDVDGTLADTERDGHRVAFNQAFEQAGMSLAQLVDQTGLSQERVEAILSGRWMPSPRDRETVARALEIDVNEISWGHTMSPRNVRYHRFGLPDEF